MVRGTAGISDERKIEQVRTASSAHHAQQFRPVRSRAALHSPSAPRLGAACCSQRMKQTAFGKNTQGYDRYTKAVPRSALSPLPFVACVVSAGPGWAGAG